MQRDFYNETFKQMHYCCFRSLYRNVINNTLSSLDQEQPNIQTNRSFIKSSMPGKANAKRAGKKRTTSRREIAIATDEFY